jgi:hypothetical protein
VGSSDQTELDWEVEDHILEDTSVEAYAGASDTEHSGFLTEWHPEVRDQASRQYNVHERIILT